MVSLMKKALEVFNEASKKFKPYQPVILVGSKGITIKNKEYEVLLECYLGSIDTQEMTQRDLEGLAFKQEVDLGQVLDVCKETQERTYELIALPDDQFKEFDGKSFKKSLELLKRGMAKDNIRPVLCSVYLDDDHMVAVDGYRIMTRKLDAPTGFKAIIPNPAVEMLIKLIPKSIDTIKAYATDDYIVFLFDGMILKFNTISGEFFNWKQLVNDKDHDIEFNVDRKKLLKQLTELVKIPYYVVIDGKEVKETDKSRISKYRPLLITFDEELEMMGLSFNDIEPRLIGADDLYSSSHTKLNDFTIACNPWYLMDAIKALHEDETVKITMISQLTPINVIGSNGQCLVLPIRINREENR